MEEGNPTVLDVAVHVDLLEGCEPQPVDFGARRARNPALARGLQLTIRQRERAFLVGRTLDAPR